MDDVQRRMVEEAVEGAKGLLQGPGATAEQKKTARKLIRLYGAPRKEMPADIRLHWKAH